MYCTSFLFGNECWSGLCERSGNSRIAIAIGFLLQALNFLVCTGLLFSRSLLSLNNVKEDNNNVKEGQMKETDEQNETYLGKDEPSASADQDGARKNPETREVGGPGGPEPTRYGDWEKAGRCCDF
ncbi:hypothetical protein O6H91_23G028000 [Diphasiastrum complanatum]|uniref:Uncharacterized protein n=1 Tax=Diphasiastrum complanatum TaxID=34168 RepID=A0ACC2A985_DIPCM|nr:hypothetical protein O6H91_23G028000 [Diphasiastrum complanatum]